jgi:hypothetical protein
MVPVASAYRSMYQFPSGSLRHSTIYVPPCEIGTPPHLGVIFDSNSAHSIAQSPAILRPMSVIENSYLKRSKNGFSHAPMAGFAVNAGSPGGSHTQSSVRRLK